MIHGGRGGRPPGPAAYAARWWCSRACLHLPNSWKETWEKLDRLSLQPIFPTYALLLRSCGKSKALSKGKHVHEHIIQRGHDGNIYMRNLLLQMYGECGAVEEARILFQQLHTRDRFSWNFIIRAYVRHGYHEEALQMFELMKGEGVMADKFILVSTLSACASHGALIEGKRVHSQIAGGEFELDVIVVTALVHMYGKCDSLEAARSVFDRMHHRDTISWNAMIAVYAHSACFEDALQLFDQMEHEGVVADRATFVNVLSACSNEAALVDGKQLHTCIMENGFESDIVVGTALVNMYGKCSSSENARKMFDRMHERDVVSWNAMIAAYVQHGHKKSALELFQQMKKKGVKPDKFSFLSILEAFSDHAALPEGQEMHVCITINGLQSDLVVGTALVSMYGKCGSVDNAWRMFDKMPERNVVSWNTMIAAYAQNGQSKYAFRLFEKMQRDGLRPDKVTLFSMLDACDDQADVDKMHTFIMDSKLELDDVVGSALVCMYGKCGSVDNAWRIFHKFPKTSVVLWNAMIAACAQNEQGTEAHQLFEQMQWEGVTPDKISFISILDAYVSRTALAKGKWMHLRIMGCRLESDVVVDTALVNMYVRCGSLEEGRNVFDKMPKHDLISWTALITGYSQHGQCGNALELFERMQQEGFVPDKVTFVSVLSACATYATLAEGTHIHGLIVVNGFESNVVVGNAVLNMYCHCGSLEDAWRIFERLLDRDNITFASILAACANWSALPEGKHIHTSITGTEIETDILVGNALVNMYAKCGSLNNAQMMFDKMQHRDTITWTALIAAYAQHGQGMVALDLFNKMQLEGVQPNAVTFVSVLSACSHDGLVDEGCQYFVSMKPMHGIMPLVDHYDCMIDLLGRVGRLEEAENLIKIMPFRATVVSWTSLLGACRILVDVERGERAAEQVFQLEPENFAVYVMLSNIYAVAGRDDDSAKVLSKMRGRGLEEYSGCNPVAVVGKTEKLLEGMQLLPEEECYTVIEA